MCSDSREREPCAVIDSVPSSRLERLRLAVAAFAIHRTPRRLTSALLTGETATTDTLDAETQAHIEASVRELEQRSVDALFISDNRYPERLRSLATPPPILFTWGNTDLLNTPAVGMCGSRGASEKGIDAARACGRAVGERGLTVVSGYARGVDTETHLAALESGGHTMVVLAEGILHFRVKRVFRETGFDPERVLVLSQFAPAQRWNAGAAMTRNAVIAGLGKALVVIEAGETGGTLDAGMKALSMGRPVMALEFSEGTPAGNSLLFTHGAIRVDRRSALRSALDHIGEPDRPASQLRIL